ncbi:MAG TPA: type II toxin-antitoxin system RelE/ParE family toxin [Nanoarchaeota archaeon]|nr:type II toxin-antitoxin system RelE/ParE family toxin [Candidatus Woesearchaeota archaeon]HIH14712.1 type II toxin-antitoxin system RelE/ParE family toxin [Nanoarchaeota archaeon]HIH59003.1 type II toxin-antitoxin system RelE/ParE family toxin [Nanoarchaeota archaeon]HII14391.1 type II toxin-antitoxin system RelE/ParE family toxin [Nanoarchaeota archaeon]HIJ04986.1 type II toxin-antitoxin system RelE/ParE family toxin [Nanoarchaeota archaeon]
MYTFVISEHLDKKLSKLIKKNKFLYEAITKKAEEIILNPHHYKNPRSPMQGFKRVHVGTHFVLIFSVDEDTKTIILEDYDHHDKIY